MDTTTPSLVSTKKTFISSKRKAHKRTSPQPETHPNPSCSAIDDPLRTKQQYHQEFPPLTQNFSSRNSLRASQPMALDNWTMNHSYSMPNMGDHYRDKVIRPLDYITDVHNYFLLNGAIFLRAVDNMIFCTLCSRVADEHHKKSELHIANFKFLRKAILDKPLEHDSIQMYSIREFCLRIYNNNYLSDNSVNIRLSVVQLFQKIISRINPECYTRIIGSLKSRTSLTSSNIGLELIHPNSELFLKNPRDKDSIHHELIYPGAGIGEQVNKHTINYDLISNPVDTLYCVMSTIIMNPHGSEESEFEVISDVKDLNLKVPRIVLKHKPSDSNLKIFCYADSKYKLTSLISSYMSLDERACMLSVLVKYWAKCHHIDQPNLGSYSSDVFVILVIYYLQRTSPPVLPCLHEILSKSKPTEEPPDEETNDDKPSQNELLTAPDRDSPQINSKMSTNDPNNEIEADDLIDDDSYDDLSFESMSDLKWTSLNQSPVHHLFIDFLRTMMDEFESKNSLITIRTLKRFHKQRWNGQLKPIENPVRPSINLSRSIGNAKIYDFIRECFARDYYYLTSIPLKKNSTGYARQTNQDKKNPLDFSDLYYECSALEFYFRMFKADIKRCETQKLVSNLVKQDIIHRDVEVIANLLKDCPTSKEILSLTKLIANLFDSSLRDSKTCAAYCWLCKDTGHSKDECPKWLPPELDPNLWQRDSSFDLAANFDSIFINFYKANCINEQDSLRYCHIVADLQEYINSSTYLDCHLELYGSTVNNLGSHNSDLDICMTLNKHPEEHEIDCVNVLETVLRVISENRKIENIIPILSARVPIIKFSYNFQGSRYDIDLSMYNRCGTYNTKLIKAYSDLDVRLAQLFFLVKKYARACQIADATKGSLSSYAWSLLVIHYLQQIRPPVLPNLQERPDKRPIPMFGVNGWNVWFDDLAQSTFIKNRVYNTSTLTQLFKGFFYYYAQFDFDRYVVSIRKSSLITKFQKSWNGCLIAIEDPFELTYNLSGRLDEPMAMYIKNSFAHTFKHIVLVQESFLSGNNRDIMKDLFNSYEMTKQKEPPFRGCRICHHLSHRVKDCPKSATNRSNRVKMSRKFRAI